MQLQSGQNAPVGTGPLRVELRWTAVSAMPILDASAFLLDGEGKVPNDDAFIFYGQRSHPSGAIALGPDAGDRHVFTLDPGRLPAGVERAVLALSIDPDSPGSPSFGALKQVEMEVGGADTRLRFQLNGAGMIETALIMGEFYLRNGAWKFRALGQGFAGGLGPLAIKYGVDISDEPPASAPAPIPSAAKMAAPAPAPVPSVPNAAKTPSPAPTPAPVPKVTKTSPPAPASGPNVTKTPPPTPVPSVPNAAKTPPPAPAPAPAPNVTKTPAPTPSPSGAPGAAPPSSITLAKRQPLSLDKPQAGFGKIVVNLNWNRAQGKRGFFGFGGGAIDLDLGCMLELNDGYKNVVQALGDSFGDFDEPPYAHLLGDDRSGDSATGETLLINGAQWGEFKRALIYAFIYKGAPDWAAANAVITINAPGIPELVVRLDEPGGGKGMCAIAMLENDGGRIRATKYVEYFRGHEPMDKAYGFGFNWQPGRK